MRILYDEFGDVLDVFFKDGPNHKANAGHEIRDGVVIYVSAKMKPVQLTVVNFHRLTQHPAIHFSLLARKPVKLREELLRLAALPPLSTFLRIDSKTYYGRVMSPDVLKISSKAA